MLVVEEVYAAQNKLPARTWAKPRTSPPAASSLRSSFSMSTSLTATSTPRGTHTARYTCINSDKGCYARYPVL